MKFERGQLVLTYDIPFFSPGGYKWMLAIYLRKKGPFHLVWNIEREETTNLADTEIRHLKPNVEQSGL